MSRTIRTIAFALAILAFFIFVGSPFGQSAKAVAVVDDAIIAIIIVALAGMGITFLIDGTYYTAYDWISGIISEMNISFQGINYGVNTKGNILLNNRFVQIISTIATYIKTKYNLVDNSTHNVISYSWVVVDELTGIQYTPGTFTSYNNYNLGTPLFSYYGNQPNGGTTDYDFRFNGTYYRIQVIFANNGDSTILMYTSANGVNWGYITGTSIGRTNHEWIFSLFYKDGDIYFCLVEDNENHAWAAQFISITGIAVGESLDLKTGILEIPTDQDIGDNGGIIAIPVPWGDTLPEVVEEIPTLVEEGELEGNTELELENEETVAEEIDQEATNAKSVSVNPGNYQSPGLPDVFPFCIPFDIYAFFECLAAEPVAPSFTWRFYVPGICDEEIELDLSEFDSVAQIVRTMELLAFIVGLAIVTRNRFLRG